MLSFKYLRSFIIFLHLLLGVSAWAGPQFITYEGYLTDSANVPINLTNVTFDFAIWNPGTTCLLYSERRVIQPINGNFAAKFGPGNPLGGSDSQTFPGALTDFSSVFVNSGTLTGSSCTYTPSPGHSRILRVQIYDTTTAAWTLVDNYELTSATSAFNADRLEGIKANQFLQIVGGSQGTALDSTQVAKLVALLGTGTPATFSNQITFSAAPQFSGTPSAASDITNKFYVDTAISTAVSGSLPNVGTSGTYYQVTTDAKGRVTSGVSALTASDIPSLDASKISTGTLGGAVGINTSGNLYSSGTITGGSVAGNNLKIYNGANYLQISATSMTGNLNWFLPNSNGSNGQVLKTDGAGNLSWATASAGSVTGVTASAPLSAGSGATPNISIAQSTTSVDGYLASTDFVTFNSKLGSASTHAGDVSGVYNALSVDKLKGVTLSVAGLTSGNFLRYNGSNWANSNLSNADITTALSYNPLNRAGDSMMGLLFLSTDPSATLGAATKQYVDSAVTSGAGSFIRKDGTVAFTGTQSMGSNKLTFVTDPVSAQDAATKNYADTKILGKNATAPLPGQDGQSLRWNNSASSWEYYSAGAGTVTSVTGTAPIAIAGTASAPIVSLNDTAVTPGTFGSANAVPNYVVDNKGRLTSAANTPIAISATQINATGAITGQVLKWNGSSWAPSADAGLTTETDPSVAAYAKNAPAARFTTTSNILDLAGSGVTAGTYSKVGVDLYGRVTVGLSLGSLDVTGALGYNPLSKSGDTMAGTLILAADPTIALGAATKNYSDSKILGQPAVAPNGGQDGQSLRWNQTTLTWSYYTPTTSTGITSLNGATGSAQTFLTGSAGTAPLFNTATTIHTLNIPMANTASVTAGLISKTEYDVFNNKLGTTSTFAGDVSGSYGALSVDKLKGFGLSISSPTTGNFLKYVGASWINSNLTSTEVTTALGFNPINKAGDSMTGLLFLSTDPSTTLGAATKQYVDSAVTSGAGSFIRKDGTVAFTGTQSMGSNKLTFVTDPVSAQDAATKNYADTKILGKNATAPLPGQDGQSLRWNNSASSWDYVSTYSNGSTILAADGTSSAPGISFSNSTGLGLYNAASGNLGLVTGNIERMRILNSGNIGFGITTPTALLHLKAGAAPPGSAPLKFQLGTLLTTSEAGAIEYDGSNLYYTDSTSARRAIATSAQLGTYLPLSGGALTGQVISNSGTSGSPALGIGQTNTGLFSSSANVLNFSSNGFERARIDSIGNLGVGTTTPASLLHTFENAAKIASYTGISHFVNNTSATGGIAKIGMDIQSTGSWTGAGSVNIGLNVNATGGNTNYAALFQGGNVGIGTSSPNYLLEVGTSTLSSTAANFSSNSGAVLPTANFLNSGLGPAGSFISYSTGATTGAGQFKNLNGGIAGYFATSGTSTGYPTAYFNNFTGGPAAVFAGNVGIGTMSPSSSLEVNGPIATAITTPSLGAYTILASDSVILVPTANTSATYTLPSATAARGRQITVKNPSSNAISLFSTTAIVATTSPGSSSYSLLSGKTVTVVSDGSNWYIIAGF